MADRPGALGQVASRIGALRADIVSVAVHRHDNGVVVDEFLLRLPDDSEGLVEMLKDEIEQVDDVMVETCYRVDDGTINLTLTNVVWFELLADDCEKASEFYRAALDWRTEPVSPIGDRAYHMIFAGHGVTPIGGIVHQPKAAYGSPAAGTVVYVEIPDLEAALASFEAAGGAIRVVTRESRNSSAVVADPWGNRLGLWQA